MLFELASTTNFVPAASQPSNPQNPPSRNSSSSSTRMSNATTRSSRTTKSSSAQSRSSRRTVFSEGEALSRIHESASVPLLVNCQLLDNYLTDRLILRNSSTFSDDLTPSHPTKQNACLIEVEKHIRDCLFPFNFNFSMYCHARPMFPNDEMRDSMRVTSVVSVSL